MRSMQIVDWAKPLELREYDTPDPQRKEVLVRIKACGVCHSDLHIWSGHFDLGEGKKVEMENSGISLPFTMGHEPLGVVEAIGSEVDGIKVGESYVVYPWIGCGTCARCLTGDELLCATPKSLGTVVNGGYSDYLLVPDARYLIDHSGVDEELACTYACSGLTAYSAIDKAGPLADIDFLLLIGAGGVGMSAIHLAHAMTSAKVLAVDTDPAKRAAALAAGAVEVFDNSQRDSRKAIMRLTGGGAGAVIDFVGAPQTAQFGMSVLRKGGTQVQVGLFGGAMSLATVMLPFKMMNWRGSYVGTLTQMRELMALAKGGHVPPLSVTYCGLLDANDALADLGAGRVLGRVVLRPD